MAIDISCEFYRVQVHLIRYSAAPHIVSRVHNFTITPSPRRHSSEIKRYLHPTALVGAGQTHMCTPENGECSETQTEPHNLQNLHATALGAPSAALGVVSPGVRRSHSVPGGRRQPAWRAGRRGTNCKRPPLGAERLAWPGARVSSTLSVAAAAAAAANAAVTEPTPAAVPRSIPEGRRAACS